MSTDELPDTSGYRGWEILVSAVVAVIFPALVIWVVAGMGPFYEVLFRVSPTVQGGGIGTEWVVGNTIPALDFAVAFIHAVDVIMMVFLLFITFLHWVAFRRLAARMQSPGAESSEAVMADGSGDGGESE